MYRNLIPAFIFIFLGSITVSGQPGASSSEIYKDIEKLGVLGSVLYVAAHPDDENTRMIAWLAQGEKVRSAYLSLTRGDGGQNLIGPEIGPGLGVIRTQELVEARKIDGGHQFFTRAVDFGYSKSPEETLSKWDKELILKDIVWVVRSFKPDVIITRFPPDSRAGHGHHTASAMLAEEAFKAAGDPNRFPEQLQELEVWKPKRIYWNTGRWWYPEMTEDEEGIISLDVGGFDPVLGTSYAEIAAKSRSMHQSQGFGSTASRGPQPEYLLLSEGTSSKKDIFEGIDLTWSRIPGGGKVQPLVAHILQGFNINDPSASVPAMIALRRVLTGLPDSYYKSIKLKDIDAVILKALGVYTEVYASQPLHHPGAESEIQVRIINRSKTPIKWSGFSIEGASYDTLMDVSLEYNDPARITIQARIPGNTPFSESYWLKDKEVLEKLAAIEATKPENDPVLHGNFAVQIMGETIMYQKPVQYRWNDPVMGEKIRNIGIVPPVSISMDESIYLLRPGKSTTINVTLESLTGKATGSLRLQMNNGVSISPEAYDFSLSKTGEKVSFEFTMAPGKDFRDGQVSAAVETGDFKYSLGVKEIDYDHISPQLMFPKAVSRVIQPDLQVASHKIAYIQGAGDEIPKALRRMGLEVDEINAEDFKPEQMLRYGAIVLGIRLLNTYSKADALMTDLMHYSKEGGTVIVQYNTTMRMRAEEFSPYPISISRNRITQEDAPVKLINPKHPVLNTPNKINLDDFNGWVQERGLYFPNSWDKAFEPVISSQDPGEDPLEGGILVAPYGKGYYVYTSLSWFRQLPAGVPGAYRIFANLVSLKQPLKSEGKSKKNRDSINSNDHGK